MASQPAQDVMEQICKLFGIASKNHLSTFMRGANLIDAHTQQALNRSHVEAVDPAHAATLGMRQSLSRHTDAVGTEGCKTSVETLQ